MKISASCKVGTVTVKNQVWSLFWGKILLVTSKKKGKTKPSKEHEPTWDKLLCEFAYYLKEATLLKIYGETILYWTAIAHNYLYIKVI